ncbi:LysR family transcriptional regulator [Actinobaculum sp. 313]|uniref:LysR family transcriptional regulator n=1 Tax=Actinobaculum sp. 313 TaxID=2495645 RepID=UPI000D526D46|nr:LysR family transcriptional regulator [Actinobaculum sp. 313]AWE42236.1 LysR family transcriptional regulator [Actinobaculum sp. 313]
MNFEQLRQLEAVAEFGTVSAAADELIMSQSALSRSLARLEKDLGIALFDRHGRSISLNRAGATALEYVHSILREERLMRAALNELANRAQTLTVGTVAPAPLWRLTALAVERFPGLLLSSQTIGQSDVERRLISAEIDLAISLQPLHYPAINSVPLMSEQLSVLVPESHRLAAQKTLTRDDLDGETFLLYAGVGCWLERVQMALPHSTLILQEDFSVFQQLVPTSGLLSFTTDAVFLTDTTSGVVLPLPDEISRATYHLLVRGDGPREAVRLFEWVAAQSESRHN